MSLITRTDVTAVKFYKDFILAGIGSWINVFNKITAHFLKRTYALNGQKIYGFVPSKCDKLLCFGGKQFTVFTIRPDGLELVLEQVFEAIVCDDWLHCGVWTDESRVALLTAHNVVQIYDTSKQMLISQHHSKDNSILYSGLLLPLAQDVLVFAGTVFSEVIIHRCGKEKPLQNLKGHRGVIFSICCYPQKEVIVTTSDDRSVRIWGANTLTHHRINTIEYWDNANIVCKHEVYGHTARVMKSCITDDIIISVGEDAAINFWNYEGQLLRKNIHHQNACIWSVDVDDNHLVTGGGDCGVVVHPLTVVTDYGHINKIDIAVTPKKVVFTARRNIVVLDENDNLTYYNVAKNVPQSIYRLNHESTYKLLSISSCKQIVAFVDMCGNTDIFIECCKDEPVLQNIISTKLNIGKVLSMQWAGNRHLVFCSENGVITVLASNNNNNTFDTEIWATFILPPCKERWATAAAINSTNLILVLGDRCGNIHVFVKGCKHPIQTFNKVHGRYGPTSITLKNNEIITTGRDGTIKHFLIKDEPKVKYMSSKDLEFQWVEKFLDRNENIISGFQERTFVVYDIRNNTKILEVPCGGGHRSWDVIRCIDKVNDSYEEFISLMYIKNSEILVVKFNLSKIISRNIINGSHSKEINCLETFTLKLNTSFTCYISGGEDTMLRISSINSDFKFQDDAVFKHLSSIRTLKTCVLHNNKLLLLSAGGRAQICVKILDFKMIRDELKVYSQELIEYFIKGTDKERKGNKTWIACSVDFDPETRIMDLDFVRINEDFIIFTGCSDACIRVFKFTFNNKLATFNPVAEIKHHKTCILKTHCTQILNKEILITCTTRGAVTFWNIPNIFELEVLEPFFNMTTNKSGINGFSSKTLSDSSLIIATGGDDNSIYLSLLKVADENNLSSIEVSSTWTSDKFHSSQITGLVLLDDILVSASIDQRITVLKWKIEEEGIACEFFSQTFSDVPDIQGIDVVKFSSDDVTVCVYGKGMEVIQLTKTR